MKQKISLTVEQQIWAAWLWVCGRPQREIASMFGVSKYEIFSAFENLVVQFGAEVYFSPLSMTWHADSNHKPGVESAIVGYVVRCVGKPKMRVVF